MAGTEHQDINKRPLASHPDESSSHVSRWHRTRDKLKVQEHGPELEPERRHLAVNPLLSPAERLHAAASKVHAVVKFTRSQRLKQQATRATKKLLVFVLSHVGMTTLVALYAVVGGFIFQAIERPAPQNLTLSEEILTEPVENMTEIEEGIHSLRRSYVETLWNITVDSNVLYPEHWKKTVDNQLALYAQEILKMARGCSQSVKKDVDHTDWTYPRSLLFAITIITTIGYGNTVPETMGGKVVCMFYALFGVPLTLLCLANIGIFMASVYKFTWKHLTHLGLVIARSPAREDPLPETSQVRIPILVSLATMIAYILGGATIFSEWEGWSFLDGCYFCFITLSTIGFGDYVPGQNLHTLESNFKRVVCALYLLFGLALLSMAFQLIQDSVLVVVRRYASFLGLSDSKIDKDIEKCVNNGKETKVKGKGNDVIDKGVTTNNADVVRKFKMARPVPNSEASDSKP